MKGNVELISNLYKKLEMSEVLPEKQTVVGSG